METTFRVERRRWVRRGRERAPYCESQREEQVLIKRTWWGRRLLWERVIDREEIPEHVTIARGALGYDDSGWRSKFAEHIDAQRASAEAFRIAQENR